jgi:tetratricopeptide (TPR) repeat protein
MEQKYPKGIPADHKYAEQNKRFMSQLYFGRGAAAMHLGKYNIAVADFTKAIAVYKPLGYMYGNKSRALFLLKKYKEAAEAYDMAYLITPEWALNAPDRKVLCATFKESGINPKACQSEEKDKSSNLK